MSLGILCDTKITLIADGSDEREALEALRVKYLGKKGELTAILKQMGGLSAEERPVIGQLANEVRAFIENEINEKKTELLQKKLEEDLKKFALIKA